MIQVETSSAGLNGGTYPFCPVIPQPIDAGSIVSVMMRTHGLHLLNGPYARAEAAIFRDCSHSGKRPRTSNHLPSPHDVVLFIMSCMHHPLLDGWVLSFLP